MSYFDEAQKFMNFKDQTGETKRDQTREGFHLRDGPKRSDESLPSPTRCCQESKVKWANTHPAQLSHSTVEPRDVPAKKVTKIGPVDWQWFGYECYLGPEGRPDGLRDVAVLGMASKRAHGP